MPTTLYSVARSTTTPTGHGFRAHYADLVSGVSHEQATALLAHESLDARMVRDWLLDARSSVSAHRADGELAVLGDVFEHIGVGPRGESYKLVAVTVFAPYASELRP